MIIKLIAVFVSIFTKVSNRLRYYYYDNLLGSLGKKVLFKAKVFFYNPENISIGDNVFIGPFCRIETYNSFSSRPILSIESNVSIQHSVHIYCSQKLIIKKGSLIASGCMITDNNHGMNPLGDIYLRQPLISKQTIINEGVWLGENVCVNAGSTIGERSIIGSNSVVIGNIPSYSIAVGSPARVIKSYNFETQKWEKV